MTAAPTRGSLVDVPDFSRSGNAHKCIVGHQTGPSSLRTVSGLMISTLQLYNSSSNGCFWCTLFWKAVQESVGVQVPSSQDFIYWRYSGESYFEPWCAIQKRSTKIQIYTTHAAYGTTLGIPVKTVPSTGTSSNETVEQIERWRRRCEQDHTNCRTSSTPSSFPRRLLDISEPGVVKLVDTEGTPGKYVCLSHQWGKDGNPIKTTKDKIDDMKKGIPEESLPLTYRHAVAVARTQCPYLWIDSLCIVQDDPDDWRIEAAQMATIYENGVLTIAAAAATGPTGGLFHEPASTFAGANLLPLDAFGIAFPIYVRRHPTFEVGHISDGQKHGLLERGWVLQERLISPRVVYFGFNEVAWECMASTACQCETQFRPYRAAQYSPREPFNPKAAFTLIARRTGAQDADTLLGLWHRIVNTYTGLDLTFPKDKFPALAGLATEVGRIRSNDQYIAGLWRRSFLVDLLWRRRVPGDWHATAFEDHYDLHNCFDASEAEEKEFASNVKVREWRGNRLQRLFPAKVAPSWSWAKMHDQVEYDKETNSPSLGLVDPEFAELLAVCCQHMHGTGELEDVESTSLTMRGKLALVTSRKGGGESPNYLLYRNNHAMGFSAVDFGPFDYQSPLYSAKELFCFRIARGRVQGRPTMATDYGLVLLGRRVDSQTVYERVGMFQNTFTFGEEQTVFDDIQECTLVRIV